MSNCGIKVIQSPNELKYFADINCFNGSHYGHDTRQVNLKSSKFN